MRNIPNYITFARLLLVPLFVVLLLDPTPFTTKLAVAVFICAAFTDYLDGAIARRYAAVSDFGKLLDPLADKLLVMAALVMLLGLRDDMYGDPWVPGWMVFLVLAREIWITGMRGVSATKGLIVPAKSAGKIKNVLQIVAIVFLLLHSPRFEFFGLMLTAQVIGLYLLLFSILFSYVGAYEYTMQAFRAAGFAGGLAAEPEAENGGQAGGVPGS